MNKYCVNFLFFWIWSTRPFTEVFTLILVDFFVNDKCAHWAFILNGNEHILCGKRSHNASYRMFDLSVSLVHSMKDGP